MGRFRLVGNDFFFASNTRGEVLAFSSPLRGEALARAILGYAIYPDISGWSPDEIVEELERSGLISYTSPQAAQPQPQPKEVFRVIKSGKNGEWWEHASGVAKYFDARVMNHKSSGWSDDRWHGRKAGGFDRMTYRSWTAEDVTNDFLQNPASWRKYEKRYNPNTRENEIIFAK